jgi:hypothetical protein
VGLIIIVEAAQYSHLMTCLLARKIAAARMTYTGNTTLFHHQFVSVNPSWSNPSVIVPQ